MGMESEYICFITYLHLIEAIPRHMSPISRFRRLFSCSLTTISILFNLRWSFSRLLSSFPAPTPPGLLPVREAEDDPYGTFTAFRTILRCCCRRLDFDMVRSLPLVLACANRVETRRARSSSIAASTEQPDMRLFGTCVFLVVLLLVCFFCPLDDSPTQKSGKSGNPGTPLWLLLLLLLLLIFSSPGPGTDADASPSVISYRPRCSVLGRAKLYQGASTVAGPMDRLSVAARASSSSTDDTDGGSREGDGGGSTGPAGGEQEGQLSMFIATFTFYGGGGSSPKCTYTCT